MVSASAMTGASSNSESTNAKYGAAAFDMKDETVGSLKPLLLTMLAAVAFVLLIACVNLANLLLARASTRQRETAIRAALGADRARLVRQFVAEGLSSARLQPQGLLIAMWSVDGIVAFAAAECRAERERRAFRAGGRGGCCRCCSWWAPD